MNHHPSVSILGIGTAVPEHRLEQTDTARRFAEALKEGSDAARWAKRIFKQCGVDTRYTCEPNLLERSAESWYFPQQALENAPSTSTRMQTYKRESVPLAKQAAVTALADAYTEASEITHLITVSCTGQFLPGMDTALVWQLGLSPQVNRIPLNFLGCAAGLKAINLAKQIAMTQQGSKALVVCVELCTLHIQPSSEREALFAASFFGDGASACVIGTAPALHHGLLQLGREHAVLLPNCAEEMVWEVGDYGFDLYLSPNIPKLLGATIPAEVEQLLNGQGMPEIWAIHPGGRGIVDTLQQMFKLTDEQTSSSRSILRNYGNMSSATLLFVLDEIKRKRMVSESKAATGIAMAFGPGISVEMIQLDYVPSTLAKKGQNRVVVV